MEEKKELFVAYGAALLAVLWYTTLVWQWWGRRGRAGSLPLPPGPAGLPVLGSLPFLDPQLHTYFAGLARAYGPILSLRLGTKLAVVVSSPALAREVLREHDRVFANRDVPAAARVIAYGGCDIVWTPDGPTLRMLRKVCVREMLGAPSLDALYGLRRREVRAAVARLYGLAGEAVDVGAQVFLVSLNVITGMLWGGAVGGGGGCGGKEGAAVGREFREVVGEITELLGRPNVSDFFPEAVAGWDLQGVERRMRLLKERFDRIFETIIDRRGWEAAAAAERGGGEKKNGREDGKDFLDYMLRLQRETEEGIGDSKTPFTMTHVKALLMDKKIGQRRERKDHTMKG